MRFASAYASLNGLEREFCEEFVTMLRAENERRFERLTVTLDRMSASIDFDGLTDRERDQLQKPLVRAAIRERVERLAADQDLTPERIIREHARIAFANVSRFFAPDEYDANGHPVFDATRATVDDWAAVASFESEETFGPRGRKLVTKLKFHPKQNSLDMLAKWHGLVEAGNEPSERYRADHQNHTQAATLQELAEDYAKMLDE